MDNQIITQKQHHHHSNNTFTNTTAPSTIATTLSTLATTPSSKHQHHYLLLQFYQSLQVSLSQINQLLICVFNSLWQCSVPQLYSSGIGELLQPCLMCFSLVPGADLVVWTLGPEEHRVSHHAEGGVRSSVQNYECSAVQNVPCSKHGCLTTVFVVPNRLEKQSS